MKNAIKILAREYARHPFDIISVERFERDSQSNSLGYRTTRGAFIFPISGQAEICFDDSCFWARYGMMIHGCPGKQLFFQVPEGQNFHYINIYYYQNNSDILFEMPVNMEYLLSPLEQLADFSQQDSLFLRMQKEALFEQIFSEVFKEDKYPDIFNLRTLIEAVAHYIEENCDKPHTLKSLAAYAGKKPQQLSYLFYKYMGIRPIDYLIACRMKRASMLLSGGELSIQTVAKMVGYSDPFYFSRIFKKKMGYTPKQAKGI